MFARLFREETGRRGDLTPSRGCVREAVLGRGRPKRRLKASTGLLSLALCSRGCFGKRPAEEETCGLTDSVVLGVVFARLFVGLCDVVVLGVVVARLFQEEAGHETT